MIVFTDFKIGQKVKTTSYHNQWYGEWKDVPLWVAGIQYDHNKKCLNITVSECWPPKSLGDFTDGFYTDRIGIEDDLEPV